MKNIYYIFNLLQDINILHSLVRYYKDEFDHDSEFLITDNFIKLDITGIWKEEINELSKETNSNIFQYSEAFDAWHYLKNKSGFIFAASESNLSVHKDTHELFSILPPQIIKVTLQHGYECLGFLHNKNHDIAHGKEIKFNSDILCSWLYENKLQSTSAYEMDKIIVTGSTQLLSKSKGFKNCNKKLGLICENMHSARLNAVKDLKSEFLDTFNNFCTKKMLDGDSIFLRPHPAGQYVIKNSIKIPINVVIDNDPLYKVDFSKYSYCISPPSSVIIDMILAEVPVAVWADRAGLVDIKNYKGLHVVYTLEDFLAFANESVKNKAKFLNIQNEFLNKSGLVLSKDTAKKSFSDIININHSNSINDLHWSLKEVAKERILLVFSGFEATQQACIIEPLQRYFDTGEFLHYIITESLFDELLFKTEEDVKLFIDEVFSSLDPSIIIFSRSADKYSRYILEQAKKRKIPSIYHIDDNLLNIPSFLGESKVKFHSNPIRKKQLNYLLTEVDLVYCSTKYLMNTLSKNVSNHMMYGDINGSASIYKKRNVLSIRKIGYMGVGHFADFESVAPAIALYMDKFPNVQFEIFGSIMIPSLLEKYENRIYIHSKVSSYNDFILRLSELEWDIGICPLINNNFNKCKSNIKWIEYTSAGIAVIASKGFAYDDCCSNGAGILANDNDDWYNSLVNLTENIELRNRIVCSAQDKLLKQYSKILHSEQLLSVLNKARNISDSKITNDLPRLSSNKYSQLFDLFYESYKSFPFDFFVRKRDYNDVKLRFIHELNHSYDLLNIYSLQVRIFFVICVESVNVLNALNILRFQSSRNFSVLIISEKIISFELITQVEIFKENNQDFEIIFSDPGSKNLNSIKMNDYLIFMDENEMFHPSLCYSILISLLSNETNCDDLFDIFFWNYVIKPSDDIFRTTFIRLPLNKKITGLNSEIFRKSFAIKYKYVYDKTLNNKFFFEVSDFLRTILISNLRFCNISDYMSVYENNNIYGASKLSNPSLKTVYEKLLGVSCLVDSKNVTSKDISHGAPLFSPKSNLVGVSVIIPFRDKSELTFKCIKSVIDQIVDTWVEIILVNNNSSNSELKNLKILIESLTKTDIKIIFLDYPHSFNHSRQCNLGVINSSGDTLIFLNNDAFFNSLHAINTLVVWSSLPNAATIGCRIVDLNDKLISAGMKLRQNLGFEFNSFIEESTDELLSYGLKEVCGNSFACAAISRAKYLEIGQLDEINFPCGYNDVDFCLRSINLKYIHLLCGWVSVTHQPGTSRGKSDEMIQKSILRSKFNNLLSFIQYQLEEDVNMFKIFCKR
jgi:hypothetical protein